MKTGDAWEEIVCQEIFMIDHVLMQRIQWARRGIVQKLQKDIARVEVQGKVRDPSSKRGANIIRKSMVSEIFSQNPLVNHIYLEMINPFSRPAKFSQGGAVFLQIWGL